MFCEICNLEDVIQAVVLERILFENIPDYSGDFIDGDQFYFQATEIVLGLAQYGYYLDHTESTLYFFRFEDMLYSQSANLFAHLLIPKSLLKTCILPHQYIVAVFLAMC